MANSTASRLSKPTIPPEEVRGQGQEGEDVPYGSCGGLMLLQERAPAL